MAKMPPNPGLIMAALEAHKSLRFFAETCGQDMEQFDRHTKHLERKLADATGCKGKGCHNYYCDDC